MTAERALSAGLLNHLVPEAELEGFTFAMAQRIAANAPLSVSSAKQQLRALLSALPIPAALAQREPMRDPDVGRLGRRASGLKPDVCRTTAIGRPGRPAKPPGLNPRASPVGPALFSEL